MSGFNENILVERSQQYFLAATHDPSVVATQGAKGTLYLRVGPLGGQIYQKQDDGVSTNWSVNGTFTGSVVQDNGVTVGTNVVTLNFIGAVVTNPSPGVVDITVSAGGLTAAANVGAGAGVFRDITGGNTLNLRSLVQAGAVQITQNLDDITIASDAFNSASNVGGGVELLNAVGPNNFSLKTLAAGANISITELGGLITIAASASTPTGTANTAAYFDNLGNLASEAAFGYDASQNFLSVGTVTSVGSNNVMGVGATISISGVTSNMLVVGNTLSPSNGQNSYVGGNNYSVVAPLRSVITGDAHVLAGVTGIQNSFIGGSTVNTTGSGVIANSIIAGGGFTKTLGLLTSALIVGNGISNSTTISSSIISGNTYSIAAPVSDSLIVGSNHTLTGANTLQGNIIGGVGNTLNNGPDNNLIVGSGNQLQLNCHRNIVGGNLNNISSTNTNNLVVGDSNILQIQAANNLVGGQSVTTISNSVRNIIAGFNYSTPTLTDSVCAGSSHTLLGTMSGSLVVGTTLSLSANSANSVFAGTTNTINIGAEHSIIAGRQHVTNGLVNSSVMVGENFNGQGVFRSFIGGTQNTLTGVVGDALVITNLSSFGTIEQAIVSGSAINTTNSVFQSMVTGTGLTFNNSISNTIVTGNGGTFNGSLNSVVGVGQGVIAGNYNTCLIAANTIGGGGNHNGSLIVGSSHTIAGLTNCAIVGSEINATSTAIGSSAFGLGLTVDTSGSLTQTVVGRYNAIVSNARFIVGNGAGVGSEENAFVVRNSGFIERTQAGLAVKIRIDAGAVVSVNIQTDYAVVSTAAASNINLPANPLQGQEFKIKSVAGSTVNPSGGDTIDGAPSLALAAQEAAILVFDQGTATWYRMN